MNKKIWIGLISAFIVLGLVLGIQMIKEKSTPELEKELVSENSTNNMQNNHVNIPTINEEKPEIDTELVDELPLESEVSSEPEILVEAPEALKDKEPSVETPKVIEPSEKENESQYIILSVSVKTLLDKKDKMNSEKWDLVPKDGWIFTAQKVEFFEGESAFNVLLREMKKNKIHMEFIMTPLYNSNYIQGIGNLYEFDCGELSGWMYAVNKQSPNFGSSNYTLKDGDIVELLYTCDLGRDLGFEFNE